MEVSPVHHPDPATYSQKYSLVGLFRVVLGCLAIHLHRHEATAVHETNARRDLVELEALSTAPYAGRRDERAQGPAAAGVHPQCAGSGGAEGGGEAVLEAHDRRPRHPEQRGRPGVAGPVHRRRDQQLLDQQHALQGAGGPGGGTNHQHVREAVGAARVPQRQAHDGV
ncbi:unnamed protein product [Phytophthora fragariaefolia]|uniref:Unnamed protein product n=1 Tax=Phytophthora fragariaefolia TaxID=1490495 RepID=A0A9W6XY91_9STRA|nr:unnamed protein product [Phytophthora fragariaefolia]